MGLHFAADSMNLSSFKFFWRVPYFLFLQEWRFDRSRSSKVVDFGPIESAYATSY